jgi:hypothetical protein
MDGEVRKVQLNNELCWQHEGEKVKGTILMSNALQNVKIRL